MSTQYSVQGTAVQGVSIDNDRRTFNFGSRVAELDPIRNPFFMYLQKVSRKPTPDPVFKFLEQRHQWQRRQFSIKGAVGSAAYTSGTQVANAMKLDSTYDIYGREVSTPVVPKFLINGQIIAVKDSAGTVRHFQITAAPDQTADGSTAAEVDLTPLFSATTDFEDNAVGEIVGSAYGEATGAPDGWKDEMYNREGYCQIFKTAIPLFSGSAQATEYRGRPNEYQRVWKEKLMEHAADIEKGLLLGVGSADESGNPPKRRTWGIVPYTEAYGRVFNFTYANTGWDDFLDESQTFFEPELGNSRDKLVLASRKITTWLNKIQDNGLLKNTTGGSAYRMDIANVKGPFSHNVTTISNLYGSFHFVMEPFLRGPWEDYAIVIDLKNVAYRPLVGNGVNRDTHIKTNVQDNDVDGRQDLILTEAGLEISLPETHAVMKFV